MTDTDVNAKRSYFQSKEENLNQLLGVLLADISVSLTVCVTVAVVQHINMEADIDLPVMMKL